MTDPLIQLVYVSTAIKVMSEPELESLLTEIRSNNQKLGVTGMLLYRKGDFIQVLEGPESVVKELYKGILQDKRHTGAFEMLTQTIDAREFANWSMGFKRITADALPGYNDFIHHSEAGLHHADDGGMALALMRNFARR